MNITNVTVTKIAEEKTENASYVLEYSVVNDELNRLHVSVNEKEADMEGNIKPVGIIYMEQGVISCNFPAEKELGPIFLAFDKIQRYIRESINPKKES